MVNKSTEEERRSTPPSTGATPERFRPGENDAETSGLFYMVNREEYLRLSEPARQQMRAWYGQATQDANTFLTTLSRESGQNGPPGYDQQQQGHQHPHYPSPQHFWGSQPHYNSFEQPDHGGIPTSNPGPGFHDYFRFPAGLAADDEWLDPQLQSGGEYRHPHGLADYTTLQSDGDPGIHGPLSDYYSVPGSATPSVNDHNAQRHTRPHSTFDTGFLRRVNDITAFSNEHQPLNSLLQSGDQHQHPYGLGDYNGPSQADGARDYDSYNIPASSGPGAGYNHDFGSAPPSNPHIQPQGYTANCEHTQSHACASLPPVAGTPAELAPVTAAAARELWDMNRYKHPSQGGLSPSPTDPPPWPGNSDLAPAPPEGPFIRAVLAPGTSTGATKHARCNGCIDRRRTCQAHYVWPCTECKNRPCEMGENVRFVAVQIDPRGFNLGQNYRIREISNVHTNGEALQMQQQQQEMEQNNEEEEENEDRMDVE